MLKTNMKQDLEEQFESLQKNLLQNHFLLVIYATLASDNPSRFRKNLLERI